ncbi:hypothetical protein L596_025801 [Steinernema carpocapsae]|uniref:Uncharacterized protein n=1 Tax=Steinernema carpocapsae TaxID=34508 RepID=A0A4U5M8U7_STECR|nr:hypothetical protein L596_025801 [Steinernema carpocapsae]
MTHPLMLLLGALLAALLTGVASECDRFRGFEVAFSFNNEVHRFKFAGSSVNWRNRPNSPEGAHSVGVNSRHFTQRGHVLLGLLNELIEFRFDVKHGERIGVDGKKLKTITSPQSSVAPESFYVCNATDKICDLRGKIVGNIDLPSVTVLGDVLITGNSSINVTSGKEMVFHTELKYVPGNIFDPANGQAYDTTPNENGQLIGVLRGKKIYVQECSGDRTAINSIKYECVDDNCETLLLDSPVLNCFMIDGCEIAYGPQTIFPSVAIVPKNPISKDEIDSTAPPPTPSTLSPTSTSTAPPTTTTTEPPPRYIVLKTPPGYKKREDRLAQMEEDEDEYEDDEEEEFDITEWYFSLFVAFVVIVLSGVWAALTWVDWHRRRRLMRAYERRQAAVQ